MIDDLVKRYPALAVCRSSIQEAVESICASYSRGGKVIACGNGGSASDAEHIVGELMKGFILKRPIDDELYGKMKKVCPNEADYLRDNLQGALPAISLMNAVALNSAFANDQAPDLAMAQQVLGLGTKEDILIGISTSGNSTNVIYALDMARESIVLLKNQNNILPLKKGKIKSLAVVGINAGTCEFGDYSGTPASEPVSILDGIKAAAGNAIAVKYAPWVSAADATETIAQEFFPKGLKAEYYSGTELKGTPKTRTDEWINFEPTNQAPDPFIPDAPMSVRWTGTLRPSIPGEYTLCLTSDDGCRLFVDGKLVIDAWGGHAVRTDKASLSLEAGKEYDVKVEYYNLRDYAVARLGWVPPKVAGQDRLSLYGDAGKLAKECDVVVAVMGINKSIEREGKDRDYITLPADQQEFLQELYHVNKNVVLVLVAGSSLSILWEDKNLPAIVNAWYPGEKGGTAVADVLFGKYNPAGRLPLTYYNRIEDLPPFDDYDITKRTYKYFEGDVLYPFGYGLSYTNFRYSNLKVEPKGETVEVTFTLKNAGKYDGDEVAQVYTRLPEYEGKAPIKELRGFKRVHLKKGECKVVTIPLRREDLRYWSESQGKFIIPEGLPEIMVGASSSDIRLKSE